MYLTKIYFLSNFRFFITEVSNIIAETNDDFSHDHFELLNFILAQKLTILEGGLHCWPLCNFRFSLVNLSNIIAKIAQNDLEKNCH